MLSGVNCLKYIRYFFVYCTFQRFLEFCVNRSEHEIFITLLTAARCCQLCAFCTFLEWCAIIFITVHFFQRTVSLIFVPEGDSAGNLCCDNGDYVTSKATPLSAEDSTVRLSRPYSSLELREMANGGDRTSMFSGSYFGTRFYGHGLTPVSYFGTDSPGDNQEQIPTGWA